MLCGIWVPPVEEDDAAEDACLGPVACYISHTLRVLVVVEIPPVTK
jgi:hypothetical protein